MTDQYLVLDENFEVAPPGWTKKTEAIRARYRKQRPCEEVLESALAFHLETITEIPLVLMMRARQFHKQPDVVAIDGSGRLHLFEVKRNRKSPADACAQLERYVVERRRKVVDFVKRPFAGKHSYDGEMSQAETIQAYLAAAISGHRSVTMGVKSCRTLLSSPELARYFVDGRGSAITTKDWPASVRKDPAGEIVRSRIRAAACLAGRGNDWCNDAQLARLHSLASILQSRIHAGRTAAYPRLDPELPPVGWLVAPRVRERARKALRAISRKGHEVHALELEIGYLHDGWLVRRGEHVSFPGPTVS
jgi:hypothetical protein